MTTWICGVAGALAVWCAATVWGAPAAAEPFEFFEKRVRPLLVENCYKCHSEKAEKLQAGLRLDRRSLMLKGGDSGPAVVPGEPEGSLLIQAVRYETFEMPPDKRLTRDQVEVLERWVQLGAPWPEDKQGQSPSHAPSPARSDTFDWQARKREHWSWQSLAVPRVPAVKDRDWPANPIDRFILARLEAAGLPPAARADRRTRIRRLSFDLVGLPPTPDEIERFCRDDSPAAYQHLVDRLMESPAYGEKWARHWLDLVRYAETCGHEFDYPLPWAHRYRDYVIRALNDDVPYDVFLTEHIAGDLVSQPRRHPIHRYNESIIGTGFWFLGEAVHAPTDVLADQADRLDNQIDVFGKTFLAATIGCARCHDHKFDPIPTQDYYALAGFLISSRRQDALLDPGGQIQMRARQMDAIRQSASAAFRAESLMSAPSIDEFVRYLLASQQVLVDAVGDSHDSPPPRSADLGARIAEVASRSGLDPARLALWVDAITDPGLRRPNHPLYAWHQLALSKPVFEHDQIQHRVGGVRQQLDERQRQYELARQKAVTLARFDGSNFGGWRATGEAFGTGPTKPGQWDGTADRPQLVLPQLAHSGHRSARLHGVLRSPTFRLTHRQIHYRMQACNVGIRLVIDGYVMNEFHALLFADTYLKNVQTKDGFAWVTQQRDLEHYQGHRVYIEIIDHGDGFAAVDQILLSDGPPPPDAPSRIALDVVSSDSIDTFAALAQRYGWHWEQARHAWQKSSLDRDQTQLINWALTHRLIRCGSTELSAAAELTRALEADLPEPMRVMAMTDGDGEDMPIAIRGNPHNPGPVAPRRFLMALSGEAQSRPHAPREDNAFDESSRHGPREDSAFEVGPGSGRLELARRMLADGQSRLARVIVNRLWHHLMGRGIVPTVDDFGVMGQPPFHPELLDWLAADLIRNGWSLKATVRQIVTSQTYQMSARPAADARTIAAVDPANQLRHRAQVRRLTAESLRDAMLSISGCLDRHMYGRSVPVHLTPFMTGRGRPDPSGPWDGDGRRTIYLEVRRNFLNPMLLVFDMPIPFSTMGRRSVSNVPAQSLTLMNHPFVRLEAQCWAERLVRQFPDDRRARIDWAFQQATGRLPTASERKHTDRFLAEWRGRDELDNWTDVCHVLLNAKSFTYLE